ncbi:MAG TPA: nucleotidyltransferase domain-containing protein [Candidatus Nanoarchaeia archaeon]|nr:nucleotidyltransferase domain-containing protein [Candidatus Nanoarchaeia archaeon]
MYLKRNDELAVLELYFGGYTRQFYLREISRRAKLPVKTTQNVVGRLEQGRILRSISKGKNKYFALNRDNVETKFCLMQAELQRTLRFLSVYPVFKLFLKEVKTSAALVVFGSFAGFMVDKDSDVDLLVVAGVKEKFPFHLLPHSVHEVFLSEREFEEAMRKEEALLGEIAEKHIVLNNHSFFVNEMWDHAK